MLQSEYNISQIINIKPFYEKQIHKKVFKFDIIIAIPKGIKCYAWFTMQDNKPTCLLIQYDIIKQRLGNISIVNACFDSILCSGTLIYGTLITYKNHKYFCVEDLLLYKNINITSKNYHTRLSEIHNIFVSEVSQNAYNYNFIMFGTPIIDTNFSNIINKINDFPFNIEYLQYRYYMNNNILNLKYYKKNNNKPLRTNIIKYNENTTKQIQTIFKVVATQEADTYELYTINNTTELYEYYQCLQIQNYKTSVKMNKIFRIIKENANLDTLEESDDDELYSSDDENINNKFIIKNKEVYMLCEYSYQFNKWVPIKEVRLGNNNTVVKTNNVYKKNYISS
jgi:hypothetical protein